jgi:hypothetical protein
LSDSNWSKRVKFGGEHRLRADLVQQLREIIQRRVMFPPGWFSRETMPLATGSPTPAKTIGIVRVSR